MAKRKRMTLLEQQYQEMVDAGMITPVVEAGRFTYPSMRAWVPSVTTYSVHDHTGIGEELSAQLARHTKRD